MIGLAVVSGPLIQIGIEEAPRAPQGIDLEQHVSIGIVARGSHDVLLRTVGVREVNPLMKMTGNDQLYVSCIWQERVQSVIAELYGFDGNEWIIY